MIKCIYAVLISKPRFTSFLMHQIAQIVTFYFKCQQSLGFTFLMSPVPAGVLSPVKVVYHVLAHMVA